MTFSSNPIGPNKTVTYAPIMLIFGRLAVLPLLSKPATAAHQARRLGNNRLTEERHSLGVELSTCVARILSPFPTHRNSLPLQTSLQSLGSTTALGERYSYPVDNRCYRHLDH